MSDVDGDLSDDSGSIVSDQIRKDAEIASLQLLPKKSQLLYVAAYNGFKKWRKEKGSNSFCEDVLLSYFLHLSNNYAPNSLWSTYSMLRLTFSLFHQVDIRHYAKLKSFLKNKSVGYERRKSDIFTKQDIIKFLSEAPDEIYLCDKVVMIFGIAGALRRVEFVNLTIEDVKVLEENEILVKVDKTKNNVRRSFVITGVFFDFCLKYLKFRPGTCETNKFFLRYANGSCQAQSIGINTFGVTPKKIALYLNLSKTSDFTGQSFRRTSATLLVDAGAEMTELMKHGGWKSSTVASGYIADSMNNKRKICDKIASGIVIKRPFAISNTENILINKIFDQVNISHGVDVAVKKNIVKKDIGVQTNVVKKDIGVQTNVVKKDIGVQTESVKLPVMYHPDIGLYVTGLDKGNFENYF